MTARELLPFLPARGPLPEPAASGPLRGLSFAAKDNFDLADRVTRTGCPDWARTGSPAPRHAGAILALLQAGARLVGQTVMDELAYGIEGINVHDGTPDNPAAPGHVCGGSSCGSAAAVVGGLCDFALGTDTAGSIRVPASWTGCWGFRPTHAAVTIAGVTSLAPSFDTVGWLARTGGVLGRVGRALLGENTGPIPPTLLVLEDAFDLAPPDRSEGLRERCDALAVHFATVRSIRLEPGTLARSRDALRVLQASEVREVFGSWFSDTEPDLAPWIADRIRATLKLSATEIAGATAVRRETAQLLDALLEGAVLALPATPTPAPRRDAEEATRAGVRAQTMLLQAPASLCGLPELVLPGPAGQALPMGLGLIGPRGSDAGLLALATVIPP